MPELPEAETIARDLARRVTGHRITGVEVLRPDVLAPPLTPGTFASAVRGRTIRGVGRRGKNVVLDLGGPRLFVNLGMTGRLIAEDPAKPGPWRHVAVRFSLSGGASLLYDDVRRFGRLEVLDEEAWRRRDRELGVEPLSRDFTPSRLHRLTSASRTPIRNWLLDQRRVAGVGNIYANEALFRARIRPDRPADSLTPADARRLRDALREVLAAAIEKRGTTVSDYRDANGEAGGFEPFLRVYGRAGEPCPRCGTPIERLVLTNRSAFFCPHCQR